MAEKIYGKNKRSYVVTENEDGWIDVRVCHSNQKTRQDLQRCTANPRVLLGRKWQGARAACYMGDVIRDYRSYFARNRVRLTFEPTTPTSSTQPADAVMPSKMAAETAGVPSGSRPSSRRELVAEEVARVLQSIPWRCWERVVQEDASYRAMKRFVGPYTPGAFMTLMVLAGLNDYQTKGKAETGYWPPLVSCLERSKPPTSTGELGKALEPFFASQRLAAAKVDRMHRFLRSGLATDLWQMTSARAAADLASIWSRIAETMHQRPSKKTIAFAAKCLAMALVMLEQTDFDFFGVPIPADSRLRRQTPSLDDDGIRRFWHAVLVTMRQKDARLTHLHLDTFLWHYLGSEDGSEYLEAIGLTHTQAREIEKVFRG